MSSIQEKAKSVKRQHESSWIAIPGVEAIGIGMTTPEQIGIVISVSRPAAEFSEAIPNEIDGIPIIVRETGRFRAQ